MHHSLQIHGETVSYDASAYEFDIAAPSGAPGATYIGFHYLRDVDEAERATRPILFVFNGGPGSSSVWTHFGIGPRRIAAADVLTPPMAPPFELVDNPDSPLDVADLVFIDPPGTGFSRLTDPEQASAFYGVEQDARATLDLIDVWVRTHRRENSPRFILGESYGTLRAARMARLANGGPFRGGMTRATSLNGVIVMGPGFTIGESNWSGDVALALDLPTLVDVAHYHSVSRATDIDAERFATHELLPALAAGTGLTASERDSVATRLADLLGLDISVVKAHNLRISAAEFAKLVLAPQGKHVGIYDGRFALAATAAGGDVVADDPGMGQYMPMFLGSIERYVREELDYTAPDRPYRGISFADVNMRWDWGDRTPPFAEFAEALRRDERLELMVAVGDYDLVTTRSSAQFAMSRAAHAADRVRLRRYASGHMPYLGAEPRAQLATDLRAFVAELSDPARA